MTSGRQRTQVEYPAVQCRFGKGGPQLNTEDLVVLNVKQAYYQVLKTKRNLVVAGETVKQFQQHLEQAKAFYEVGTKPKFDVTKAEVDLGNAQLEPYQCHVTV